MKREGYTTEGRKKREKGKHGKISLWSDVFTNFLQNNFNQQHIFSYFKTHGYTDTTSTGKLGVKVRGTSTCLGPDSFKPPDLIKNSKQEQFRMCQSNNSAQEIGFQRFYSYNLKQVFLVETISLFVMGLFTSFVTENIFFLPKYEHSLSVHLQRVIIIKRENTLYIRYF